VAEVGGGEKEVELLSGKTTMVAGEGWGCEEMRARCGTWQKQWITGWNLC